MSLIVFLLGVLAGLFVLAGTLEPDPDEHNYPGTTDIHDDPGLYVGEQVTVSGTIVGTEPLTISDNVYPDGTIRFVVENADVDADNGDRLSVHGTLAEDNTIQATGTVHAERKKMRNMYIVSFLAGFWVLARLLNQWTVNLQSWEVVSLDQSRFSSCGD